MLTSYQKSPPPQSPSLLGNWNITWHYSNQQRPKKKYIPDWQNYQILYGSIVNPNGTILQWLFHNNRSTEVTRCNAHDWYFNSIPSTSNICCESPKTVIKAEIDSYYSSELRKYTVGIKYSGLCAKPNSDILFLETELTKTYFRVQTPILVLLPLLPHFQKTVQTINTVK